MDNWLEVDVLYNPNTEIQATANEDGTFNVVVKGKSVSTELLDGKFEHTYTTESTTIYPNAKIKVLIDISSKR